MHTVVETDAYLADAEDAGMDEDDMARVVDEVARNPEAGDIIKGSGGVRKVRIARPGGGKSGGWRVLTGFVNYNGPVFLIAAFSKSDRRSISKAEVNNLARLMEVLKAQIKRGRK